MRFYFIRHGESEANLLREFSNSGAKHPLTPRGVEQARAVALSLDGLQFAAIYSSPVLRAVQTARILAESFPAPLTITEALREWDVGIYEGTANASGWELHEAVQQDWFFHNKPDSKMPGGESFLEIQARFIPFIDQLVHQWGSTEYNLLLVAHGGLYMAMLPVVLRNITFEFSARQGFTYTAVTIAEARPEGLQCLSWCGQALE